MEVKNAATYEEQKELLRTKGFIISDDDKCIGFLKTANYYRLSAYLLPFKIDSKNYIQDIPFERIMSIYSFDNKLRALIIPIIEEIEFKLRTDLAYYHGHKYGPLGYMDNFFYNSLHNHKIFEDNINRCIKDNSNTKVVKHHNKNYDGKFPIWVSIEFFSTGMLSYFYKDLLLKDKKAISRIYTVTPEYLESWLTCFTVLRNKCAHFSRLYYWTFTSVPATPKNYPYIMKNKLFDQIFMLKSLYSDKEKWNHEFLISLSALIDEYVRDIDLEHIGFPEDWRYILVNI